MAQMIGVMVSGVMVLAPATVSARENTTVTVPSALRSTSFASRRSLPDTGNTAQAGDHARPTGGNVEPCVRVTMTSVVVCPPR